jgi:hypothetical protein
VLDFSSRFTYAAITPSTSEFMRLTARIEVRPQA